MNKSSSIHEMQKTILSEQLRKCTRPQQILQDLGQKNQSHPCKINNYMGVDGLIKFLQPIINKQHLSSFRNQTAAIDTMSWIYRALYNSAEQMRTEPSSTAFLYYIHQMIDLLQYYQIKMICVFDGRFLTHKQDTITKRKNERQNNRKKGEELLEKGQEQSGKKYINRCITVDERILSTTMRALKGRQIPFIVSPYESDCQIAKLYNQSQVNFAICQDSDLIIYGVPVLLKLSSEGDCDYLNINKVQPQTVQNVFIKDFLSLSKIRRTEVAVLTGTDYLSSIKGIGIKKALKFICESQTFQQAISNISLIDKFKKEKPQNYQKRAEQAILIFLLATSYNPNSRKLEFLNQNSTEINEYAANLNVDNIIQLAGVNYGYDDDVRDGLKQVWSLQPRDLTPIPYDGVSNLNLSALREKQLTLSNLKVVQTYYEGRSPLITKDDLLQNDLRMMCENRQLQQKKQTLQYFKSQLQQLTKKQTQTLQQIVSLKRCPTKQKLDEFKQKFPAWMKYCPQTPPDFQLE